MRWTNVNLNCRWPERKSLGLMAWTNVRLWLAHALRNWPNIIPTNCIIWDGLTWSTIVACLGRLPVASLCQTSASAERERRSWRPATARCARAWKTPSATRRALTGGSCPLPGGRPAPHGCILSWRASISVFVSRLYWGGSPGRSGRWRAWGDRGLHVSCRSPVCWRCCCLYRPRLARTVPPVADPEDDPDRPLAVPTPPLPGSGRSPPGRGRPGVSSLLRSS